MTVMLDVTTLAFRLINTVVSGNHGVIFIGFPAKGKDTDPAIKIPQLVKAPNVPDHVFTRKFVFFLSVVWVNAISGQFTRMSE